MVRCGASRWNTPTGRAADLAAAVDYALARGKVWLVGHSLAASAIGQLPHVRTAAGRPCLRVGAAMARPDAAPGTCTRLGASGTSSDQWSPAIMATSRWTKLARQVHPHGRYRDGRSGAICRILLTIPTPAPSLTVLPMRPHRAAVSTDDLWAPPRSRDAFAGYTSTAVDRSTSRRAN